MKDRQTGGRAAGIIIAISIVLLAAIMPPVVSKAIPAYENTCLGWRPLVVRTNSMEGTIRKNALVITYAARWDDLKTGDVITFQRPNGQLDTHRVISKDGAHIVTQGDNASAPDPGWVTADNYKYKVIFIWNWVAWLSEYRGLAYLICLPPLLVALVSLGVFIAGRVGRRRELHAEKASAAPAQNIEAQPDDTRFNDMEMESLAWVDEMVMLLEDLLEQPQGKAKEIKETPDEPEQAHTIAADEDNDLDWDDWAFLQLRRQAAPAGDALPAIG